MTSTRFIVRTLVWGFLVWLVGYILGFILFFIVPTSLIGWIVTPIGIVFSLWVLWRKISGKRFEQYAFVAFIWTILAILLDYIFIVKMLQPADGYYKIDVYLYYGLTFVLPLIVGLKGKNPDGTIETERELDSDADSDTAQSQ
jgi:hypothetical protein